MAKYVKLEDIAALWDVTVRTVENWLKKNNKPVIKSKIPLDREQPVKIDIVAEKLDIPEKTIRKWVNAKKIPQLWWGGTRLHFKISDVIKWANNKGQMPDDEGNDK